MRFCHFRSINGPLLWDVCFLLIQFEPRRRSRERRREQTTQRERHRRVASLQWRPRQGSYPTFHLCCTLAPTRTLTAISCELTNVFCALISDCCCLRYDGQRNRKRRREVLARTDMAIGRGGGGQTMKVCVPSLCTRVHYDVPFTCYL